MFANRFTVVIDACVLVPVLPRNLILSLAEAGLFRPRWNRTILDEMEAALRDHIFKGRPGAAAAAKDQRQRIERAFPEAMCEAHDAVDLKGVALPDPKDRHVLATAVKVCASVIVTENTRDFPQEALAPFDMEMKTADAFIADTLDLPEGRRDAVAAIRRMRARLKRPDLTVDDLLLKLESNGLLDTANILQEHLDDL